MTQKLVDGDGVADDANEVSVGAVVVKKDYVNDNSTARKKIILEKVVPSTWTGNAVLSRNNTKVRVFDASAGVIRGKSTIS